jgi:hypothetical protein
MRFLLLFLISFPVFAQFDPGTGADGPCDEVMIAAGGTFNCSSLDIDNPPNFIPPVPALIIKVTGDVSITANIVLDGGAGGPVSTFNTPGGLGGPGAGDGGGFNGGGATSPGSDVSLSSGNQANSSGFCGGGGAGAGFDLDGEDGNDCSGGSVGGLKGLEVDPLEFSFTGIFRGGFGGGAGGDSSNGDIGSGGGGGGALHIMAAGTVTISGNITSIGGAGGSTAVDGGGGGGGSGGVIWIETTKQIIHSGSMNANGGVGGLGAGGAPGPAQPNGDGGDGSQGFIRLEDQDGIVGGTFLSNASFISNGAATASSSSSLESGISCGMVKPKDDNNFFQLAFGFFLVAMMASLLKTLSRNRVKL